MGRYILRNVLLMLPTLWGITVIVFIAIRLIPGDAVTAQLGELSWADEAKIAQMRQDLGLDQPWVVQYARWIGGVLTGDFGESFISGRSVFTVTMRRVPVTLELAVLSMVIAVIVAIPMGVISAVRQDSWLDHAIRFISVAMISVPNFVLATLFVLLTSIWFRWQPPPGFREFFQEPWIHMQQILPGAVALGARSSGVIMRMTRSALLDVLRHDFVRTGRAKGLPEHKLIMRHALPNSMIPVLSIASISFSLLLGGVVIIEAIFSIPGLGSLTVDALFNRDYPQLMINVLFMGAAVTLVNFFTDLSYAIIDPRIRYQ